MPTLNELLFDLLDFFTKFHNWEREWGSLLGNASHISVAL